tara:strand:+ start:1577 stop:1912 length:336 start_codon:yes stop_codon:yes gene_type:complete
MSKDGKKVTRLENYKSRKQFLRLAREYEVSLPKPSLSYQNVIFLFDEALAVKGRELLFRRLNRLATVNQQVLIVTDIGYSRTGFYLSFDELGAGPEDVDYDACIDAWGEER